MNVLEQKTAYLHQLAELKRLLPAHYQGKVAELLPEMAKHRIKNACSGVVRDAAVLAALRQIAETERQRRRALALAELAATE